MRKTILAALFLMLCASSAHAQQHYIDYNKACNSSTTPVSLIPSTTIKSSYTAVPDLSGANAVYIFHYSGTLPTSPPANCTSAGTGAGCVKLAPGQPYNDAQNYFGSTNQNFQTSFNDGLACVIAGGGSTVNVSGSYR